jgi:hypothetical protein
MILKELNPKSGQKVMGCTDTEHPGADNEVMFSRIYDLFIDCIKLGVDPEGVWNGLSTNIKMKMKYSNWSYIKK